MKQILQKCIIYTKKMQNTKFDIEQHISVNVYKNVLFTWWYADADTSQYIQNDGFAVVANEVRNLAQKSALAAQAQTLKAQTLKELVGTFRIKSDF